ncbi:transketolase C-terminal domain-containing protein [Bifidobacterium angulatum]|uniref:transketolase C-terminal domain-containing protein n=1 Tax=Bifidobacterium angulatum TaxID=1683 RepID=UPI003021917D
MLAGLDPRVYSDLDGATLEALKDGHSVVVTLEDGSLVGGFGERIAAYYGSSDMKVLTYGAHKELTDREPMETLYVRYRLNREQIVQDVLEVLR